MRLREELEDAGISLRLDDRTDNRVLAELDYARFPQRHEREFPTYGALIVDEAEGWISRSSLQTIGPDGTPLRALRLLADGRQSFVLFSAGDILLATFAAAHDRESDLVRFQRGSSRDLVIVQRTAHGVVRVYSDAALIVWDGARSVGAALCRRLRQRCPSICSRLLA